MLVKTVSASPKGQLSIPVDMLRAMGIKGRTEFIATLQGSRIVLERAETYGKRVLDDLAGFEALAAPTFQGLWDNPEDKVWDGV